MRFWVDTMCRLQSQFEIAPPTTAPVAGLPGNDGINPQDTILWDNASLPLLDEFLHLSSFDNNLPPWGVDPQGYYEASAYPSWHRVTSTDSSEGSLGVFVRALRVRGILSPLSLCSLRSRSVRARHLAM